MKNSHVKDLNDYSQEQTSVLSLVFFLLSLLFFRYVDFLTSNIDRDSQKKTVRTSRILAILFTILYTAVDYPYYIQTLTSPLFRAGILCSVFFGFSVLFFHILRLIF